MVASHTRNTTLVSNRPSDRLEIFAQRPPSAESDYRKVTIFPSAEGRTAAPGTLNGQAHKARIMVVSNNLAWCRQLSDHLYGSDLGVTMAPSAHDMKRVLATEQINMIVMARQLNQVDGLDLLRELRASTDLPVIMTSPGCDDEAERVLGLETGADDFIGGLFSLRELVARLRAVLRRTASAAQQDLPAGPGKASIPLRFGQWTLNRRTRCLTDGAGEPVDLTKSEYALLAAFAEAPQRPLSREYLLKATRVHEDVFDRSIDVQVLRLRRKLDTNSTLSSVIQTERGVGYIFTLPVESAWAPHADGLKR